MNVLVTSFSLILVGIAMIHPAYFLFIDKQVRNNIVSRRYLQTNYIVHLVSGFISVLLYWVYSVNYPLQIAGFVYIGVIIVIVLFYWNSELTKWNLFSASVIFGFIVFYRSVNEIVEITPLWPGIMTGLLGSTALSLIILLLTGNSNAELKGRIGQFGKSILNLLIIVIGLRIAWQIVILFNLSVATQYGDTISAIIFFWQVDMLKLILILLLGIALPVVYLVILRKQFLNADYKYSMFSILPFFISVFIAEILIKYFLLQFGIVL